MRSILPLLIASFLLASCAGDRKQFLSDQYQNSKTTSSVSILIISPEDLYERFPDHIFGSLRPIEQTLFDNQLVSIFQNQTRASVTGLIDHTIFQSARFELNRYPLRKDTLAIVSPVPGSSLSNSDAFSSFIVILDQFNFTPVEVEHGDNTYAGHESDSQTFMYFQTHYLIWDNVQGEAVAWGDVTSERLINPQNLPEMYSNLVSDAFYQIVEESPFVPLCEPFMRYNVLYYPCRPGDS